MKGLWKNNVNGWNQKDSKRKKQSRKHFIKDNFEYINGTSDEELEDVGILVQDKKFLLIEEVKESEALFYKAYKIRVYNGSYYTTMYDAYVIDNYYGYYGASWYDLKTHRRLFSASTDEKKYGYRKVEIVRELEALVIVNKDPKWYTSFSDHYEDTKEFYYGKALGFQGKWWKRGNPRKVYAKKLANSITRAKAKSWLTRKDYDMETEIKNHALEKSIAWEIS